MRLSKLVTMALAAAISCAPAAFAQQTGFVALPRNSEAAISFWDMGGLKRNGTDLEIRHLFAWATSETEPVSLGGRLTTYRYSCDWNAYAWIEEADVDAAGELSNVQAKPGWRLAHFGPGGWQALIGPTACDAKSPLPPGAFASLSAAMAEAARVTKRPRPPKSLGEIREILMAAPVRPMSLPNYPQPAPSRFGVVRAEPATGNVLFIDWGNFTRKGDVITLLTLEALGVDPASPSLGMEIKLNSVQLDCAAGSITALAYAPFTSRLRQDYQQDQPWPARTRASWPLGGELLDVACSGREPAKTYAGMADAIAYQRTVRAR